MMTSVFIAVSIPTTIIAHLPTNVTIIIITIIVSIIAFITYSHTTITIITIVLFIGTYGAQVRNCQSQLGCTVYSAALRHTVLRTSTVDLFWPGRYQIEVASSYQIVTKQDHA